MALPTPDFNRPVPSDLYAGDAGGADWPGYLQANVQAALKMDGIGTNQPIGTKRVSGGELQTWNGSAWANVPLNYLRSTGGGATGPLGFPPGSVTDPGLFVTGDTDTGVYQAAPNALAFTTAGVQRMVIGAAGNVSIGGAAFFTASNRTSLSINGVEAAILGLGITGTGLAYLYADAGSVMLNAEGRVIYFAISGNPKARLTPSGNFGIGVDPITTLDVGGALTMRGNITGPNSAFAYTIGTDPDYNNGASIQLFGSTSTAPNMLSFRTAGVERFTIAPTGVSSNVPFQAVHEDGAGFALRVRAATANTRGAIQFTNNGVTAEWFYITSPGPGVLVFNANYNGGGERMRIAADGTVSVGVTSATGKPVWLSGNNTGFLGHLINASGAYAAEIGSNLTGATDAYGLPNASVGIGIASGFASFVVATNATERFRITAAGVIQDGAGVELGWKGVPDNGAAISGALPVTVRGKFVKVSGNVTIAKGTFATGDTFTLFNNIGSPITIAGSGGMQIAQGGNYPAGLHTLTLQTWGVATVWVDEANSTSIVTGAGLS